MLVIHYIFNVLTFAALLRPSYSICTMIVHLFIAHHFYVRLFCCCCRQLFHSHTAINWEQNFIIWNTHFFVKFIDEFPLSPECTISPP